MSGELRLTLSVLEAIQLFRIKQPADWTVDEFDAFRERLKQSPSLFAALGGQQEVDRRLAEVADVLATASQRPTVGDVAAHSPAARSNVLAQAVVASLLFALFAGVGSWFYLVWPRAEPDKTTPTNAPLAKLEESQSPDRAVEPAPDKPGSVEQPARVEEPAAVIEPTGIEEPVAVEKPNGGDWLGWTIAAEGGALWKVEDDWNVIDPSNPQPIKLLSTQGGPVTLTRRAQIAEANHYLEVHPRPQDGVVTPGRLVVRVGAATLADLPIGSGEAKWPLYVSLEKWTGTEVSLEIAFTPGVPGQEVNWLGLEFVDTERHKPRAESMLAEELASKDIKTRLLAAKNAGSTLDLAALPVLIKSLRDSDQRIQRAVIGALLKYKDLRARAALRAALESDPDPGMRTMIAISFGKRPQAGDVPSLFKALVDPNPQLRKAAGRALAALPDEAITTRLVQTLGDSNPMVRNAAADALSQRKGEAVENALLPTLTSDPDDTLQLHAVSYFRQNPTPRAIKPLAALLTRESVALRRQVVRSLAAIKGLESTKAISQAMNDSDADVQQAAATALSRRKDALANEAFLAALGGARDNKVMRLAVAHFKEFPNPKAIQPLAAVLDSKNKSLRRAVVSALGRIPDEAAIDALSKALNDPDAEVRRAAEKELKRSRHPRAAVVLKQIQAAN